MSEIYRASGSINIDYNQAATAFDTVNKKGKKATETLNNTGKTTNTFSNKLEGFSSNLSSFATKGTAAVTAPITALGVASFKAASDLNESLSKSEVVFENNANTIKEWSKTSTTAFGASQNEALEMVSKYGAMGKAMGLSSEQTKDYSMNLTQLAGDLASFNNISIDQANTALTGVFTGETESLKGLGIVMTQTNLDAFALATGFKKTNKNSVEAQKAALNYEKAEKNLSKAIKDHGKDSIQAREAQLKLKEAQEKMSKATKGQKVELTEAEKVQLRYNYVMSKTKDAQGDYMRTSDSAANSSKTLGKSVQNLLTSFGQFLLCLTALIGMLTNIINKFNGLSDSTKKTIIVIAGLVAGIFPLLLAFSKMVKAISSISNGFKLFSKGISGSIKGIKNFGKATKDGINLLGKFGKGLTTCIKNIGKFTLELIKSAGKGLAELGKGLLNCIKSVVKFTAEIIKNTAMAIKNGAIWVANKVKMIAYKTAQIAVTAATKAMTIAQKALNLAMCMNPIGLVITILLTLAGVFVTLYNKCEWFRNGVNKVWSAVTSIFTNFSNFLTGIFTTDWTKSFGVFGNIINGFFKNISNIFNAIKRIFSGIIDFVTGVFTGNWSKAWSGIVNIFGGIMDGLGAVIKAPLNTVISLVNMAIDGLNKISFTAPDWVPLVGGKHFGVNIPKIPFLAEGGIVNSATLAMIGEGAEPEAVTPISKLDAIVGNSIKNANENGGNSNIDKLADKIDKLIDALANSENTIILKADTRVLARVTAPALSVELARLNRGGI